MQDHELYRRILGIEAPWYVDSVELKLEVGEIHVRLAHHDRIDWPCPECGAACKRYDHQPGRQWRHLDTGQYQTILHAEPPRSECRNHGVRLVKASWAEPAGRFTARFEWLKAASQRAVAALLQLGWDEIHGIMQRAAQRGLEHRQETLTAAQISGIEAVARDMWDPYIASVREHVSEPDGKIVFTSFSEPHEGSTSAGGTTGQCGVGCNRRSRWRGCSNGGTRTSSPTCGTGSRTREANRSMPRSNG